MNEIYQSDIVNDWFEVGDSQYTKWLQLRLSWTIKSLQTTRYSIAPYGGPIAIANDDTISEFDEGVQQSSSVARHSNSPIITYDSNGQKIGAVLREDARIIAMGWSSEENLLLLKVNGEVEVYNKLGQKQVQGYNLGSFLQVEGLLDAIIFPDSIIAISKIGNICALNQITEKPNLEIIHKQTDLNLSIKQAKSTSPRTDTQRQKILGIGQSNQQQASSQQTAQQQIEQQQQKLLAMQTEFAESFKCWVAAAYEVASSNKVFVGFEDRVCVYDGETVESKVLSSQPTQMAISVSAQLLAILNNESQVTVVTADLTQTLATYDIPYDGMPSKMLWVGDDSIIQQYDNLIHILEATGQQFQLELEDTPILASEIDGVRVITPRQSEFLQKVPKSLSDCLIPSSTHPSKFLLMAQSLYEKQDKTSINSQKIITSLRNDNTLEEAVRTLVDAAGHSQQIFDQERFLKAAIFGRTFQNSIDPNIIYETTQKLRIINQVRNSTIPRVITINQFEALKLWGLVQRLLNQRQYPFVFKMLQALNLPTQIVMQQWARQKIRTSQTSTDFEIHNAIQDTIKSVKGLVQYADLASYAQSLGRPKLASLLLDFEDVSQQQVQMLIDLKDYRKAVNFSLQAGNPDLMFQIVDTVQQNDIQEFRFLVEQMPILKSVYLPYMVAREQLKAQQEDEQVAFTKFVQGMLGFSKSDTNLTELAYYNLKDSAILFHILQVLFQRSFQANQPVDQHNVKLYQDAIIKNLDRAKKKYQDVKNLIAASQCERFSVLLKKQVQIQQHFHSQLIIGLSLHDTLKMCVKHELTQEEESLRNQFNIHAQHYTQIKMSALAEKQEWRKFILMLDDKRNQSVPAELYVKIAKKHEAPKDVKIQLIEKLPSDQRKAHAYQSIGEFERATRCAEKAKDQNLINKLQGMMGGSSSSQSGMSAGGQFQLVSGISQAISSFVPWSSQSQSDQKSSK